MATFQYYDLGQRARGSIVVVTLLGNPANVRLLDTANFNRYRESLEHEYAGGLARQSPVRLEVPSTGHWHLVVDLIGLSGTTRTTVEILPSAPRAASPVPSPAAAATTLPEPGATATPAPPVPAPPAPAPAIPAPAAPAPGAPGPIARIAENVSAVAPAAPAIPKAYDVFIAHASEDKDDVVRALAQALREQRLAVWYDEFELRLGDNLRRKIDAGLVSSRFGIVVLSPAFLAKPWAHQELDGLVTRELAGERQIILPIWHRLEREELAAFSSSLADAIALRTQDTTLAQIASAITDVLDSHSP
jgi:hypothetical protein